MTGLLGFALTVAAPLGVLPAAPAAADTSPYTIHVDTPASGGTLTSSSVVTVQGHVTPASFSGAVVQTIHVQVVRDADGALLVDADACCASPSSSDISFSATTPALAYNGPYHLVVTASGYYDAILLHPAAPPAQLGEAFSLGVPPAAPTGLTFKLGTDRSVQLTWDKVPSYADFLGYVVYRRIGAGDATAIAGITSGATTYTDSSLGNASGTVSYQVASVRQGPVPGNDSSKWLVTRSDSVVAVVPVVPTTVPAGGSTTTVPVGGGLQAGGAAASAPDLGSLLQIKPLPVPTTRPPPTLPDTGFSQTLPFTTTTAGAGLLGGSQPGRPSSATAGGQLEAAGSSDSSSNRRALLVPVAAGSVLCVFALHLRWLNRRVAMSGPKGLAGVVGLSTAPGGVELEHTAVDDDLVPPTRQPVGAGFGRR